MSHTLSNTRSDTRSITRSDAHAPLDAHAIPALDADQLAGVTGGFGVPDWVKKAGKLGKKSLGVVSGALSVGDGYANYQRARSQGKSVGRSILEASNPFA